MSHGLPDQVDVWRMVAGQRCFSGSLPLSVFARLHDSLARQDGTVAYALEFGNNEFGQPYVELVAQGELPLVCQRTLEVFGYAVSIRQRLGLIRHEEQEASLPPGYEPFLVPADGEVSLVELIEDELILALPLVPARPDIGSEEESEPTLADQERDNPFTVLKGLKLQ